MAPEVQVAAETLEIEGFWRTVRTKPVLGRRVRGPSVYVSVWYRTDRIRACSGSLTGEIPVSHWVPSEVEYALELPQLLGRPVEPEAGRAEPMTSMHSAMPHAGSATQARGLPMPVAVILLALIVALGGCAPGGDTGGTDLRFEISFPASVSEEPLTGRMFLAIARDQDPEPRLQVGRYGVPVFGVDFEDLAPGETVDISADVLGWPIESLRDR